MACLGTAHGWCRLAPACLSGFFIVKNMEQVFPLRGCVQHYDWGGYTFIRELTSQAQADGLPWAEWWLGDHPKGPSTIWWEGRWQPLNEVLAAHASQLLGKRVADRFDGRLPFLLKVLDVCSMLSIQVHPNKQQAAEGFEKEEQAGLPADAPHRNYRDRNHKPESMIALTPFWLLHGFRSEEEVAASLDEIPGWQSLKPVLAEAGLAGLYAYIMRAPQGYVNELLAPLHDFLQSSPSWPESSPHHWAQLAFDAYTREGQFDRGIFSVYWFNLVFLQPGQGIFQDAGIPHAYLRGANMELMANSDNVLRGGLTPKHIDTEELLDKVLVKPVVPQLIEPLMEADGRRHYPAPVDDYRFDRLCLAAEEASSLLMGGPVVGFLYSGSARINGLVYPQGSSFLAAAGSVLSIQATSQGPLDLYLASC